MGFTKRSLMHLFSFKVLLPALSVISFIGYLVLSGPATQVLSPTSTDRINTSTEKFYTPSAQSPAANTPALSDEQAFIKFMVTQLKQRHGRDIHDPQVQASLLDLKHMIAEQFGENAERIFKTILELAFGNIAQSILALLAQLEEYNHWYKTNLAELNQASHTERQQLIAQMRYQLLGEQADQIWPSESASSELQSARDQLQQALLALDQDTTNSLEERLHLLRSTLAEATALATQDQPSLIAEINQQATLANLFFGLSSVQRDLQKLPADERQQAINAQRAAMGYSEEQIKDLAQTDTAKEQRWQIGYAYMQARSELMQNSTQHSKQNSTQDESFENALADLRNEYFANEASTIAAEEASGFYRFERPRVYGRN